MNGNYTNDTIMENIAVLDALERLDFHASILDRVEKTLQNHVKLVEAAQYATCEKCDHNRCQGLRDALKGLI